MFNWDGYIWGRYSGISTGKIAAAGVPGGFVNIGKPASVTLLNHTTYDFCCRSRSRALYCIPPGTAAEAAVKPTKTQ